MPSGDVEQESLVFNRPVSDNGLPAGNKNLIGNYATPTDFYVKALPGERLVISRVVVHVVDSGTFDSGSYGNGIVLTNGIKLVLNRASDGERDLTMGFPIKTNIDWARFCHDVLLSSFGIGNEGLSARWSFWKYGQRYGIVLEEGDLIGFRLNDDFSGLVEHTMFFEGVHLGTPSPSWLIAP
jgi:hypothetical protein